MCDFSWSFYSDELCVNGGALDEPLVPSAAPPAFTKPYIASMICFESLGDGGDRSVAKAPSSTLL